MPRSIPSAATGTPVSINRSSGSVSLLSRCRRRSTTSMSSSRELTLLRRTPVLGGYDPADYEERRVWATAADGEHIPISLVRRRDLAEAAGGQPQPMLLYGYGSYEASMDPYFSIPRSHFLIAAPSSPSPTSAEAGRWAALVRRWQIGTQAEFLLRLHRLRPAPHRQRLDGPGSSRRRRRQRWWTTDGCGREPGATALFGIVAAVPFVDCLTTMLDASLPLTVIEYDEWGNPEADPAAYATIKAYAPYDNIAAVDYPPILAETSLNDTRVLYVEPAKWVAKLRLVATGRREFLLKTEMVAGHGGVSGRYKAWHDRAFSLAWILEQMGLSGS